MRRLPRSGPEGRRGRRHGRAVVRGALVGKSTADLYNAIRSTMPLARPGSLSNDDYYKVTAFLANANGQKPVAALTDAANAHRMTFAQTQVNPGGSDFPLIVAGAGGLGAEAAGRAHGLRQDHARRVPTERELETPAPGDWPAFNRDLRGQRFSPLTQITPANAGKLRAVCAYQFGVSGRFQPSPIVYQGVMYVTALNRTVALDAATCKLKWEHEYVSDEPTIIVVNRGVALYKGVVYRSTPSGPLIALDAATGKLLWDTRVRRRSTATCSAPRRWCSRTRSSWPRRAPTGARRDTCTASTPRPAVTSGRSTSCRRRARWVTTPGAAGASSAAAPAGPASPSIRRRSSSTRRSATRPADGRAVRKGDNLFTNSVVAVGLADGKLNWWAQQIKNDTHDWDTAAAPMLHDIGGRRFMTVVNKGGYLWLYDRDSHHGRQVRGHASGERRGARRRWITPSTPAPASSAAPSTTAWPIRRRPRRCTSVRWSGAARSRPSRRRA
jgi:hypothetical protein